MSLRESPALFNAFSEAFTGPIPIILGSTPAMAEETILANGVSLSLIIASSLPINKAAAPSFKPDEFPAVTEPPSFLKAGLSEFNFSIVVVGLINSSSLKIMGSAFR